MKRTLRDIEIEIVQVQNRINTLDKNLYEQKEKLHTLKEEKFEVANNLSKGDIIQSTKGVMYYYHGLSKDWCDYYLLVTKITKQGLPYKNMTHLLISELQR